MQLPTFTIDDARAITACYDAFREGHFVQVAADKAADESGMDFGDQTTIKVVDGNNYSGFLDSTGEVTILLPSGQVANFMVAGGEIAYL